MSLRKSWMVLLFCLTCAVPLQSAKQLTAHQKARHDTANDALLSEDLAQQLSKKLPKTKFTQWLLNFLFTRPQAPPKNLTIAPYLPYEGKTIGLVLLDMQGPLYAQDSRKKQLVNIILPTTKDWVILGQLSFASGGIIVPQQLIDSQERLSNLAQIKDVQITVQEQRGSRDTVDVLITTKDRFPISLGLSLDEPSLSLTHNNLFGWGHLLQYQVFYNKGLGYSIMHNTSNMKQAGITSEWKYLNAQEKSVNKLRVFRDFADQTNYAGKVEVNKTRKVKWRILDGSTNPQSISFSFYHQCIWLGTAFTTHPGDNRHQGRLFLTGKMAHQHFSQRPGVTKNTNRYFHHYVFGAGSLGFSNKKNYEEQLVYGVGSVENIPYGNKTNLIGGYQFGEFINRPYLGLDIAQEGRIQQLGHLSGAVHIGGFWREKAVEQGILQLQLGYFTPLLSVGHQRIRQFIRLNYLAGYNMFTGELISTNISKAPTCLRDPFLGGTQRLHLGLETVLLTPMYFAGCRLAALGFVDAVRLQDAQGKDRHRSFYKTLGIGLRCMHPRFAFGTLQVKIGYAPITKNMIFAISTVMASPSDVLDIGEPEIISFREY